MLSFAGFKASREQLIDAIEVHFDAFSESMKTFSTRSLTHNNGNLAIEKDSYLSMTDIVIENEMADTKDMTRWPCKSFRDFSSDAEAVVSQLPIPISALVANCSEPLVKCSVRYDINEFNKLAQ